jgi:hypothetical protein
LRECEGFVEVQRIRSQQQGPFPASDVIWAGLFVSCWPVSLSIALWATIRMRTTDFKSFCLFTWASRTLCCQLLNKFPVDTFNCLSIDFILSMCDACVSLVRCLELGVGIHCGLFIFGFLTTLSVAKLT